MHHLLISSRKGFSILIALGSIGVLMIIVIGLIQVFLTEMKLSRYQYDYILASEQAEGAFEYAMLKVANHRDGFEDRMTENSLDQVLFSGSTSRTSRTRVTYDIQAQTGSYTKNLSPGEYLIVPLFVGSGDTIDSSSPSIKPNHDDRSIIANNPQLTTASPADISWSIVGSDADTNISLGGTGDIDPYSKGAARLRGEECFTKSDGNPTACPLGEDPDVEKISYFYDRIGTTKDFLKGSGEFGPPKTTPKLDIKNPYIMIFNSGSVSNTITLSTSSPFTLPELIVTTEAKKGDAVQRIRYSTDKSKYYDAIKYGAYNTP